MHTGDLGLGLPKMPPHPRAPLYLAGEHGLRWMCWDLQEMLWSLKDLISILASASTSPVSAHTSVKYRCSTGKALVTRCQLRPIARPMLEKGMLGQGSKLE